jgi:DNA-binding beta-propeller fold protein YncE
MLVEVDTATGRVVRALDVGLHGPHQLAVSADRSRAYATSPGSDHVSAFDLHKWARAGDVEVGKGAEGLALSADGRWLWVTHPASRSVSLIDTRSLDMVQMVRTREAPARVAVSPDGKTVVVTEPTGGELAVYEARSLRRIKRINFCQAKVRLDTPGPRPGPMAAAFSPDGKLVYCTVPVSNAVAIVDLERGEVTGKFSAGITPYGIVFAPGAGQ